MAGSPQELQDLLQPPGPVERDEAWGRFVECFSRLLLHVCRSLFRDHDQAMDCYAYVLEELRKDDCRRLRKYVPEPGCKFTTWLVVVVRRLCLDFRRTIYPRPRKDDDRPPVIDLVSSRMSLNTSIIVELDETLLADPGLSPEQLARIRDRRARLQACLSRLAPAQRLLLTYRFVDELPGREIASLLQLPTTFHAFRAIEAVLKQLRQCLAGKGITDPEA